MNTYCNFRDVSLKCACVLQLLLYMETGLLIFCACADNHVALLFINKVGGSRRDLSLRLSGLPLEPRCLDNRGSTVPHAVLCIPSENT